MVALGTSQPSSNGTGAAAAGQTADQPVPAADPQGPPPPTAPETSRDVAPRVTSRRRTVVATESVQVDRTQEFEAVRRELIALARAQLPPPLQREVAHLVNIMPVIGAAQMVDLIGSVRTAAACLRASPPNTALARRIRRDVCRRAIFHQYLGAAPQKAVVLGLLSLTLIGIPVFMILLPRLVIPSQVLGINTSMLILVATAGTVGSITSIMVDVAKFKNRKNLDQGVLFLMGMFRPIIGATFALLVFAAIKAKLVPLSFDATLEPYVFMTLSFVAGLSERFGRSIADRAEGTTNIPTEHVKIAVSQR